MGKQNRIDANRIFTKYLSIDGIETVGGVLLGNLQVVDMQGEADALVLDDDGDTTISAPTDDQIDIEIAGADDFQITANTFTALSGSTIETNTIAETTPANGIAIDGLLVKDNALTAWQDDITLTAVGVTLLAADSGKTYIVTAADQVFDLPATVLGLRYRFILATAGLSASTGLSISPVTLDKVMGNGLTGADNKDAILAGATDAEGDMIEVVADGSLGWYIVSIIGTWSIEA